MGDYTSAQLIVYSCPPEEVKVFLDLIAEYDLKEDWSGRPPAGEIILGNTYGDNSVNTGFVCNTSVEAPNSAWARWVDPLYEHLGDLEMHVPGLGYFHAECNSDGQVRIAPEEIVEMIKGLPVDVTRDQVLEEIGKLTGKPWDDAIAALKTWGPTDEGPTVKAAPQCGWCEELIVKDDADQWMHKDTGQHRCADQGPVHLAEPEEEM